MPTYHLPSATADGRAAAHSAHPSEPRARAEILPLYPDLLRYQRLEQAVNHARAVLDTHGFPLLADELCDSFNSLL